MIEKAVYQYLIDPETGSQETDRVNARQRIRERVGTNVNIGRRPINEEVNYAITIERNSTERYDDWDGEAGLASPSLLIAFWGKGQDAVSVVMEAEQDIREALVNYFGDMAGVFVRGATVESDFLQSSSAPRDKSERWTHRYSLEFRISHDQPAIYGD